MEAHAPQVQIRLSPTSVRSVLILVGAAAAAIGSALPWVSVSAPLIGSISRSGIQGTGDGWITLGAALVVGGLAIGSLLGALPEPGKRIGSAVLALGVMGVSIYDWVNIDRAAGDLPRDGFGAAVSAGPGFGIFLTALGGLVVLVGALFDARSKLQ